MFVAESDHLHFQIVVDWVGSPSFPGPCTRY